jgi:arylsulfatase A-like enzyme
MDLKMRRREFIAATAAAAVGLVPARTMFGRSRPKRTDRPNILYIMTDQQQAKMMSCRGEKWVKTPALDGLVASGTRFEKACASNPVCVPSRFSLQTGLMPNTIGMGRNEDSPHTVVTDAMMEHSLGRLFHEAGYETVYGGKVHLPKRMNRIEKLGYRYITSDRRQGLADTCAKFLKGRHDRPFFLFASFINPHDICYMAINAFNRFRGKPPIGNLDSRTCEAVLDRARKSGDLAAFVEANCPPLPPNHQVPQDEPECITLKYLDARPFRAYIRNNWTDDQWRLHRWTYRRLTERVDKQIGTVLDAFREAGLEDNTLIVFTSDHGEMDSAHKMDHKSVLYREAVRIPFIMSFKGRIPAGAIDNTHLISNGLDLLPTLCDYAGIEAPRGLYGRSLRPLASGKNVEDWRRFVVTESQDGRMLRTARFKYCIYDCGRHREQLIDRQNDPGEMKNLAEAAAYKDVLDEHRALLRKWVEQTGDKIAARYIHV